MLLLIVGILVTPVGALVGTLILLALGVLVGRPPAPTLHAMGWLLQTGTIAGSLHAAPTTMFALPIVYATLRRRGALGLWRVAVAGGIAGITTVLLFDVFEVLRRDRIDSDMVKGVAVMAAIGWVAGAASGTLYAWVMRRLEPEVWRGANDSLHIQD